MGSDYIEELIRQGENTSIEFKQGDVRTENLAKELIAFSNSSGGVVLLGIEDNGEIQGLKNLRNYEERVMGEFQQSIFFSSHDNSLTMKQTLFLKEFIVPNVQHFCPEPEAVQ